MRSALVCLAALALSCSSVARVAQPALPYETVNPHEYAEAEASFADTPPEVTVPYWNDQRCQELLDKRDALLITAATLGGLTGVGGVATLIPKDADEDERKQWDLGLGISTLVGGAASSAMMLSARVLSERYEQNCRTEHPVPVEHPAADEVEPSPDVDGGVQP